jgi:hypothetical protein
VSNNKCQNQSADIVRQPKRSRATLAAQSGNSDMTPNKNSKVQLGQAILMKSNLGLRKFTEKLAALKLHK